MAKKVKKIILIFKNNLFLKILFLSFVFTALFWFFSFFLTEQKPVFTPLYAEFNLNNFYLILPLVLLNYFFLFKILKNKKTNILLLIILSASFLISFNSLKKNISFYEILNDQNNYYYDALEVKDLKTFLKRYEGRIFYHRLHTRTHPPGPVLFHYFLNTLKQKTVNALVLVLTSLLNMLAVFKIAKFLKTKHKNLLMLLLLSSPGFIMYGASSMDAVYAFLISWSCYLVLKLTKEANLKTIIITSLFFFLASFFTYASVVIPLFAIFLIFAKLAKKKEISLKTYLISLLASFSLTAIFYLTLYLATGFNPINTFLAAKNFNTMLMPDIFMTAKRYLYSTTANLTEYIIFLSLPIFSLLMLYLVKTLKDKSKNNKPLPLNFFYLASFLTPMLILNFAGIYKTGVWSGETGRIWLFLTPLIIAGINIKNKQILKTTAIMSFIQSLVIQLTLNTFW
jgi:hypothetical protein